MKQFSKPSTGLSRRQNNRSGQAPAVPHKSVAANGTGKKKLPFSGDNPYAPRWKLRGNAGFSAGKPNN
jgi:hypothetical protein